MLESIFKQATFLLQIKRLAFGSIFLGRFWVG